MTWYCKDFPGAAELRDQLAQIETVEQGHEILESAITFNKNKLTPV